MSDPGSLLESRSIGRAVVLGIGLFLVFCLAAGGMWLIGVTLGIPAIPAFLMGACAGPLIVLGVLALWLAAMPLERRQKLLGVGPTQKPTDSNDSTT